MSNRRWSRGRWLVLANALALLTVALPAASELRAASVGAASASRLTVSIGSASTVITAKAEPVISFPVTLSKPATSSVTVQYRTSYGSAKGPTVYQTISGTLTFPVNPTTGRTSTTKFLDVLIGPGSAGSHARTFLMTLSHAHGADLGNPVGVGTILPRSSGSAARVSIGDTRLYDGTAGSTRTALLRISLSQPATQPVSVHYSVVGASAAAGKQYQAAKSGIVKIGNGSVSGSVSVTVVSGSVGASPRTFSVKLTAASGASISRSTGTVTIVPEPPALMFDDEFNDTALDLSKWQPNWLGANNSTITKPANIAQKSCFDPKQVSEPGDGFLHLAAVARSCPANDGVTYPYASGLIETQPHFSFTYGLVQARIWLPGKGKPTNWPAFWTDGLGKWPTTGELDVMEGLSGRDCWAFHSSTADPNGCAPISTPAGWHTFGARWAPGSVTYLYDGKQVGQIHSGVTAAPMYPVLNLGIGGEGPISVPAAMLVDWIRISRL